ncbi:DedA family protein [Candidatus Parcubacteria bacterium]|nr:DedA family protein [Candidatus Parcubacteria bacterium]
MLHQFINFMLSITENMGYSGIIVLMTVESSFIPFPSEIVIPPAAFLANQGEMNIFLVVFFGILGSLIGASINYFLALKFGRKIVYLWADHKIAKTLLITPKKIKTAEDYFIKHGRMSTFFGRLVPAVRQLISIPAGFSKMKFSTFLFFTFLGSGTWTVILAALGYYFGDSQELLHKYYTEVKFMAIFVVLTILVVALYRLKIKKKLKN